MNGLYNVFAAIVGKPNVGKSSLINELMGEKIAIVSDKPQTTRTKITGVLTQGNYQYVFLDTPGFHKPKTKLSEHMVESVNESVSDVDVALLVVEPSGIVTKAELSLMETFRSLRIPAVLVINKIDLIDDKTKLISRISQYTELFDFASVIPVSVWNSDGTGLVLEEIKKFASEGPHFFPDDTLTDQPERVIVAEMLREKMLSSLREEVPHGIAVLIESMKDRETALGTIVDIRAEIICEKNSHKGIIIGKNGAMLKKIASEARVDMEGFLNAKVNLQCWVKVRDDWRNKESLIHHLGFHN